MIIIIVIYLLLCGVANLAGLAFLSADQFPILATYKIGLSCAFWGGVGGFLYCLRAVYLNICVRDQWDPKWHIWYFLRPIASIVCGGVSYMFLKAGLIILESSTQPDASDFGFYAFAFVAGLNVDKFVKKLEEVAEAVWGIEKSRTAESSTKKKE